MWNTIGKVGIRKKRSSDCSLILLIEQVSLIWSWWSFSQIAPEMSVYPMEKNYLILGLNLTLGKKTNLWKTPFRNDEWKQDIY